VQEHPPRATARQRRDGGADGVLPTRRERGHARADAAVVLAPVAVAAAPHLVDATLGDFRTELGFVVDDRGVGEVVHLPTGLPQAELQVDLLGVEEELLVEQADLVQCLAPQDERGAHHPVDRMWLPAARLLHAQLPDGQQADGAHERRRKAPGGVL